jgi:DNA-binding NtrC family response regulator
MHDAAAGRHPLHVARPKGAVIAEAIAMLGAAGQHVRDRLDVAPQGFRTMHATSCSATAGRETFVNFRNAVERAVILCEGALVTSAHLPGAVARKPSPSVPAVAQNVGFPAAGVALAAVERDLI